MDKKHDLHFTPYTVRHVGRPRGEWGARVTPLYSPPRHYDRVRYTWRGDVAQINPSLEQRQDNDNTRIACKKFIEVVRAPDGGREALWVKLRTTKESWDADCLSRMGKYVALAKARAEKKQANMASNYAVANLTFERIEFDLTKVPFDMTTLERTLYVFGIHAHVDETLLTKLFAPFGLEVSHPQGRGMPKSDLTLFLLPKIDESTGFPCVDLFISERTHRPRGDARLVFTSAGGAARAVEEMQSA